jgi:hypothetical protein
MVDKVSTNEPRTMFAKLKKMTPLEKSRLA